MIKDLQLSLNRSIRGFLSRHPRIRLILAKASRHKKLLITSFVIIAHIAGALTSVRAIMEVRTSQGAVAWAVALNTMPYVSVPAYWVFGRSKFKGYVLARRKDILSTDPTAQGYVKSLEERNLLADDNLDKLMLTERLAKMRFTKGNDVELLINGDATFESIFEGIEQAKDYILVEFYIIRDDTLGQKFKRSLIAKAKQGVRVHLLYDEVGSSDLPDSYLEDLAEGGVSAFKFNSTQGAVNRFQVNFRNHRKIVVVDGKSAWVGGLNVGDDYLGHDPEMGFWRDTHVKVEGPAVKGVQIAFLEDWHWASQQIPQLSWEPEPATSGAQQTALCLPTGPADTLETCTLFFLNAINQATDRLWLASPYFVPDEQFISALQLAAIRGVDVRILLPEKTDSTLVQLSGWSYVPDLEKVGIKVYRYQKGFLHQKVMLVDDRYATVGTANFDNRSFRLNFEITMAIADRDFARQVAQMLEEDFANSELVTAAQLEGKRSVEHLSLSRQSGLWPSWHHSARPLTGRTLCRCRAL